MSIRPVKGIFHTKPHVEGAGVKLQRAFGFGDTTEFDPFLLFDDFRNENPDDYLAGFPWHPHRGIETITYVLAGTVEHGDSLGNRGNLGAGDVQWMTAGSGILHQEMPQGDAQGRMHGFQLWANLPSSLKMTAPRYQDVVGEGHPRGRRRRRHARARDLRRLLGENGPGRRRRGRSALSRRLGSRRAAESAWPSKRRATRSRMSLPARGRSATRPSPDVGPTDDGPAEPAPSRRGPANSRRRRGNRSLVLFDRGDEVVVQAGDEGIRFLLVSGKPIEEPVAWYGPIVMNTKAQLQQAIAELRDGTFIKLPGEVISSECLTLRVRGAGFRCFFPGASTFPPLRPAG